jgi:hypothetical protein
MKEILPMSDCVDKKLGQLLHDYELGLLSNEDNRRFEMHLYECDYCLEQVREFMDVSRIISKDPDAVALIENVAEKSDKKKTSPYLRLLIAAILVVIVAIPVYRYGIYEVPSDEIQTLELLPTRVGGSDVIYLEKGGNVELRFFLAKEYRGAAIVTIMNIKGDTVVVIPDFSEFDANGMGTIIIPISDFDEGHYSITIVPSTDSEIPDRIYMFRAK